MFGFLRQFARLLSGKVAPFEIGLGAFFGALLALTPSVAVDPGTGLAGFSVLWLMLLFVFLALRASIPVATFLIVIFELLERLFLGNLTAGFGRFLLEDVMPQSFAIGLSSAWPSAQLHTWWGFGGFLGGILLGLALALPFHALTKRKLPAWRERFGQSRAVRWTDRSLTQRIFGWWLS
ncbi:MAG: hypothetical protein O3A20_04780 [Planctomycetota bacterium]|nr:hypothetical protein [Planctomycetota bacterium]